MLTATFAQRRRGILLILASVLCFTAMSGLVRQGQETGAWNLSLARFFMGAVVVGSLAMAGQMRIRFVNWRWLWVRGIAGAFAVSLLFYTITRIGVGKATVINYTFPVWGSLFSAWILRERAGLRGWIAIAIAVLGMGLLLTPEGGWGHQAPTLWEGLGVLSALCAGMAVLSIRKLHETDNTPSIFLFHCLVGFALTVPLAWNEVGHLELRHLPYLLGVGGLATAGQLLMTQGYRYLPVAMASTMGLLVPVGNTVQGIFIFHENFPPEAALGAVFVLVGCLISIGIPSRKFLD